MKINKHYYKSIMEWKEIKLYIYFIAFSVELKIHVYRTHVDWFDSELCIANGGF